MRRHRIGEALRDSLEGNGFRLVFQPKFTLSAQPRLAGAEVLLRWQHPELGEVSPAEFIPIAETTMGDEMPARTKDQHPRPTDDKGDFQCFTPLK